VVSNVEDDYAISTKDVAELMELVAKLMERNKLGQVYMYLSIPSTSSIPSWQNE